MSTRFFPSDQRAASTSARLPPSSGIRDIIIPPAPGTFSAFGLICSDLKVDKTKPIVHQLDDLTDRELTESFADLERESLELLRGPRGRS